jgi:hypothetical protein
VPFPQPSVNSRKASPGAHACDDLSCGIFPGDCPVCWTNQVVPVAQPDCRPDHILDTLAADISRRLWDPVGDVWGDLFPGRPLPEMLRDVRRRPADRVLLGLLRRLLDSQREEAVGDIARRVLVDVLPDALQGMGLLPDDDDCTPDEGGAT